MSEPGPVSTLLKEQIKTELRSHGIVTWLDKDNNYSQYVDTPIARYRQGDFFAPVFAFRGSYLRMVLAMENCCNGLDKQPMLIHMPRHSEESIRKTPMLEFYLAGFRFRKKLETLIQEAGSGLIGPKEIEDFLKSDAMTLEGAEEMLNSQRNAQRGGLAHHLDGLTLEWVLDGMLGKKSLQSRILDRSAVETLLDYLYRHTGMDKGFLNFFLGQEKYTFDSVGDAFAGWLMCVEYVNDLKREPYLQVLQPLRMLSPALRKACGRILGYLRDRYPDIYEEKANLVEARLAVELDQVRPEDLGKIDTFRREETSILEGAVQALLQDNWEQAAGWATLRHETPSFWLQRDLPRRFVWSLIGAAAELGQQIQQIGRPLATLQTLSEALNFYTSAGFLVDRSHHQFEQMRLKLLEPTLPHFALLLEVAEKLRKLYRLWADQMARDFARICQSDRFLPEENLQQCSLYEQMRIQPSPIAQSVFSFMHNSAITLGLRVPGRSDIRLFVKEAIGAELANQQICLSVGETWVELFFDLKGDRDERVQVEIFHPIWMEVFKPIVLSDYFAVSGQGQEKPPVVKEAHQWQAGIEDPAIRSVFVHLQIHGAITESELIHMLGSPRNARRFTRDFDELVQKVPFSVRIETNSSGKRYVRQDG